MISNAQVLLVCLLTCTAFVTDHHQSPHPTLLGSVFPARMELMVSARGQ